MDRRSPAERYEFVSVDNLLLSVRIENALLNANIDTIGRLIRHTESELTAITGISPQAIGELKAALAERNLWLVKHKRKPTEEPVKAPPEPEPAVLPPPPLRAPPPVPKPPPHPLPLYWLVKHKRKPTEEPVKVPPEPERAAVLSPPPPVLRHEPRTPPPVPKPPPYPRPLYGNYERGSSAFVTADREGWIFRHGTWQLMSNGAIQEYLEKEKDAKPFIAYPKMMFHLTQGMTTVQDKAEQDALGPDWSETPIATG
jgi:Bacterial RNA polymerase, alpha chain C terminal domain